MLLKPFIILCALGGLALSSYIFSKKHKKETMVCPLDSDCEAVVNSEFSKFFGIPLEFIGILYYGLLAVIYATFLLKPDLEMPLYSFGMVTVTTIAVLFSGYLTSIQAFTLKEWCTWCLTSASISTVIFITSLFATAVPLFELFKMHIGILATLNVLGLSLGAGGITVFIILLLRFLKDLRINEFEAMTLRLVAQFMWIALGVVLVTGIGVYAPFIQELGNDPVFNIRLVMFVGFLILIGCLEFLILPRLVRNSLGIQTIAEIHTQQTLRRSAIIVANLSLVSWYLIYLSGLLPFMYKTFFLLFAGYVSILVFTVIVSVGFDKMPHKAEH